jgi:acyl-CoA synthetase (AMP-forming)/AMP-acid ligase II
VIARPEEIVVLGDIARYQAKQRADAVAFHFEGRETTYAEFDRRTNRVANALIALGLRPGDRIAHLGKNSDLYFELLFGSFKAGVVLTPVNWRLAAPEIAYVLKDSGARALFVGPEFTALARDATAELSGFETFVALEGGVDGWPAFADWRDGASDTDPQIAVSPDDVALQLYTSGTTGLPKGAMLTHRGLIALRGLDTSAWNTWSDTDVALVAMPNGHISGSGWGVMATYNGAKAVVAREFDPAAVLDLMERHRLSKIFMVPAAMQIVVRHPKARQIDWSPLKYMLYGASPIPLELLKECMGVFGCGFVQMYGMTETSGTIVALPPEDHTPEGSPRMNACGKAMTGVELAILDEAGHRLPPFEVGEVATRSGANMAGYWNLPEATAKALSDDGWLRTGDAGYLDEDGYLFIRDRVKDMIVSGGENVYPAEVENAIFGCPGVADVAVIGVPDPKWGEAVKAMVVRHPGADIGEAEVIAHARARIAGFKAPKSVDFVDALPRNASGKILRRDLRAPYWAGAERQVN